jgi:hypothetical protein
VGKRAIPQAITLVAITAQVSMVELAYVAEHCLLSSFPDGNKVLV